MKTSIQVGVGDVHSLGTDQPWLQEELDRRRAANDFKQVAFGYSAGIGFGALGGWPGEFTRGFVLKHPRKLANRSGNSRNAAPAPSKSGSTISGVKCRSFRYPSHAQSLMRLGAME